MAKDKLTPNLELVDTKALFDELARRHNACIFVYERVGDEGDTSISNVWWKASPNHAVGLISYAKRYIDHWIEELIADQFDFDEAEIKDV